MDRMHHLLTEDLGQYVPADLWLADVKKKPDHGRPVFG
jgi:hypothetical protein